MRGHYLPPKGECGSQKHSNDQLCLVMTEHVVITSSHGMINLPLAPSFLKRNDLTMTMSIQRPILEFEHRLV